MLNTTTMLPGPSSSITAVSRVAVLCVFLSRISISSTWRSACPCTYNACSGLLLSSWRHCPLWWARHLCRSVPFRCCFLVQYSKMYMMQCLHCQWGLCFVRGTLATPGVNWGKKGDWMIALLTAQSALKTFCQPAAFCRKWHVRSHSLDRLWQRVAVEMCTHYYLNWNGPFSALSSTVFKGDNWQLMMQICSNFQAVCSFHTYW